MDYTGTSAGTLFCKTTFLSKTTPKFQYKNTSQVGSPTWCIPDFWFTLEHHTNGWLTANGCLVIPDGVFLIPRAHTDQSCSDTFAVRFCGWPVRSRTKKLQTLSGAYQFISFGTQTCKKFQARMICVFYCYPVWKITYRLGLLCCPVISTWWQLVRLGWTEDRKVSESKSGVHNFHPIPPPKKNPERDFWTFHFISWNLSDRRKTYTRRRQNALTWTILNDILTDVGFALFTVHILVFKFSFRWGIPKYRTISICINNGISRPVVACFFHDVMMPGRLH